MAPTEAVKRDCVANDAVGPVIDALPVADNKVSKKNFILLRFTSSTQSMKLFQGLMWPESVYVAGSVTKSVAAPDLDNFDINITESLSDVSLGHYLPPDSPDSPDFIQHSESSFGFSLGDQSEGEGIESDEGGSVSILDYENS